MEPTKQSTGDGYAPPDELLKRSSAQVGPLTQREILRRVRKRKQAEQLKRDHQPLKPHEIGMMDGMILQNKRDILNANMRAMKKARVREDAGDNCIMRDADRIRDRKLRLAAAEGNAVAKPKQSKRAGGKRAKIEVSDA